MNNKSVWLLIGILVIAAVLRFWQLGSTPPSLDWDEASLGYNAYSLLQTGKDEYGKPFPIILQSFGDYKPALYSYLAMPTVALFGLHTFALRLPSAIFGVLTILAVYFLVKELLKRRDIALLSALLLAISPWHIQFSRVAFETNIGVALSVFAVLFFIYGLQKHMFLIACAFCLGLGLYAYQSEKVFVPLLFLVLIGVYFKKVRAIPVKYLAGAIAIGLLVALPMGFSVLTDTNTLGRAKGVSIFGQQSSEFDYNTQKLTRDHQTNDTIGLVLDNRRVFYAKQVIGNYLSHFDVNWLFVKGDIGRHHAPGMGLLYLIELPFLLIGIYELCFGRYPRSVKFLLGLWLLIAPLPASVTTGVPHAVRSYHMVPVIIILVAFGLIAVVRWVEKMKEFRMGYSFLSLKHFLFSVLILLYCANIFYYLNQYFIQMNYFSSQDWQYGYQQAAAKVADLEPRYKKIVVSNAGYLDQSYIFYLFFLKVPPRQYQQQMSFINNSTTDRKFGKFEVRKIDWTKDKLEPGVLYVGMPDEFDSTSLELDTINFLNNKPAIKIVGT